ncbi:MAG: hypothetical protein JW934_07950 [Anaerolineae bacterium]|nr:hypothetical protein [Anaerolineae bacterium]
MTWSGIFENILSDFIFLVLSIWIAYIIFVVTWRQKLFKFFGINKHKPQRLIIYLSSLNVLSGGTTGIDRQRRCYSGTAVSFKEQEAATHIHRLFTFPIPSVLNEKPSVLEKINISGTQVQIQPSPCSKDQLDHSATLIALGSPAYNKASEYIETDLNSKVKFSLDSIISPSTEKSPSEPKSQTWNIAVGTASLFWEEADTAAAGASGLPVFNTGAYAGLSSSCSKSVIVVENIPPFDDPRCGFVSRVFDREHNRYVFYVAGISELATAGATYYLATQWKNLHHKYPKDTDFIEILRFYGVDYRDYTFVSRYP